MATETIDRNRMQVARWEAPWGSVVAASHVGAVREGNEDCVGVSSDRRTIALSDGMGGHADGEVAAAAAVGAALGRPGFPNHGSERWPPGHTVESDVRAAFARAQRAVEPLARGKRGKAAPGCTLVVARFSERGDRAIVGWCGDSRAYLQRAGVLSQVTRDHSEGGMLTRCLGGPSPSVEDPAEYRAVELPEGATLLLCSDGLHGFVEDAEIARCLRTEGSRADIVRRLFAAALRSSNDNISVMLARRHAPRPR